MSTEALLKTPLHGLHVELGAKMVEFAGYEMPVHYPGGILAEHRHCRQAAALFDVSHMGQLRLLDDAGGAEAAKALETLVPVDVIDLAVARQRYAFFTNSNGGILDDLMITRRERDILLVLNAACKAADTRHLVTNIAHRCAVQPLPERALLALPDVKPAGLGARDTLRLEAGMCLYGHDIDTTTTPVEAGLTWAIQKVRRPGGARAGRYPGAAVIESQLATGPTNKRVGLVGLERVPVREGAKITDAHGHALGHVTSGTLGPSIDKPIAMAYLAANHAAVGHEVYAAVRGKTVPMRVAPMPFAPHRYFRG